MSLKLTETYSAAPNTERGRSANFDINKDGDTIIYGADTNVVIKNLQNPLKVELYTVHKFKVTAVKFSPNGYYVCSADAGGNVIVWSFDNEDHTTQLQTQSLSNTVRDISWTFDSKRIAVVGEGKKTFAHVFLWNTGSTVGEISGHGKQVLSVDFKPNRPFRIATGSEDFTSNFYSGPPFRYTKSNSNHINYVNCVRYSPSGAEYVTVSSDKTMRIYDGKTGQETGQFAKGHKSSMYQVAWSPKGDQLLTASADKTVRLWDFQSKKSIATFTFQDKEIDYMQVGVHWNKKTGKAYSLSLNGNINELDFKNPKTPKTTAGHNTMISKIKYDGNKYFYSCGTGGKLIQWELGTGNSRVVLGKKLMHKKQITSLETSGNFLICGSADSTVRFVPNDTFKYQNKSADIKVSGVPCDMSKSTKFIFVATHKGVSVIDDAAQSETSFFTINDYEPLTLSFNSKSNHLAVGGDDKLVRIYKVSSSGTISKSIVSVLKGHRGIIQRVRYSPDGKLLAVGDKFREIIVWDANDYSQKYTDLLFHSGAITDLDWSASSANLVSVSLDKCAIVWDLPKKKHIKYTTHYQGVRSVASINSKTLLTAGAGFNIKAWSIQ